MDTSEYRIGPGKPVDLNDWDPDDTSASPWKKKDAKEESDKLDNKLDQLQEMLYVEHKRSLLIVLQGMDTSGKDGVIRSVFQGVNPSGVRVVHYRQPSEEEKDHGFLWRAYKQIPGKGELTIFNRSHYEGVLVERVHNIVPKEVWQKRYEEINEFEQLVSQEGNTILKFFLHIGFEEQKKRILARIQDPTKEWKFSEDDIRERKFWPEYMKAYQDALTKTSTNSAPWFLIPSNHKWFRDILVASIIVETLESFKMSYPKIPKDLKEKIELV